MNKRRSFWSSEDAFKLLVVTIGVVSVFGLMLNTHYERVRLTQNAAIVKLVDHHNRLLVAADCVDNASPLRLPTYIRRQVSESLLQSSALPGCPKEVNDALQVYAESLLSEDDSKILAAYDAWIATVVARGQ